MTRRAIALSGLRAPDPGPDPEPRCIYCNHAAAPHGGCDHAACFCGCNAARPEWTMSELMRVRLREAAARLQDETERMLVTGTAAAGAPPPRGLLTHPGTASPPPEFRFPVRADMLYGATPGGGKSDALTMDMVRRMLREVGSI